MGSSQMAVAGADMLTWRFLRTGISGCCTLDSSSLFGGGPNTFVFWHSTLDSCTQPQGITLEKDVFITTLELLGRREMKLLPIFFFSFFPLGKCLKLTLMCFLEHPLAQACEAAVADPWMSCIG